jgi:hypothetical protein
MSESNRCPCDGCTPANQCKQCPITDTGFCGHCGTSPAGSGHWVNHAAVHHPEAASFILPESTQVRL